MGTLIELIFVLIFRHPKISVPSILALTLGYYFRIVIPTDFVGIGISVFTIIMILGLYICLHEFLIGREIGDLTRARIQKLSFFLVVALSAYISFYSRNAPSYDEKRIARKKEAEDSFLSNYNLDERIVRLFDKIQLTELGARFFYLADPELIYSKKDIAKICESSHANQGSNLFGCYDPKINKIYLLDTKQKSAEILVATTAAHELLHSVYSKMTQTEKEKINSLLDKAQFGTNEAVLLKRLEVYGHLTIDQKMNELYAIVGTEISEIPDELENHYFKYFNRSLMIQQNSQLKNKIESHTAKVKHQDISLRDNEFDISTKRLELKGMVSELRRLESDLKFQKEQNNHENYNSLVADYNSKISNIQKLEQEITQSINEFNQKIKSRNSDAYQANKINNAFSK